MTAVTIRRIARLASWLDLLAERALAMILLVLRTSRSRQPWLRYAGVRTPGGGSYPAGIGLPHVLLNVCALLGLMASYEAADTIVAARSTMCRTANGRTRACCGYNIRTSRATGSNSSKKPGTQVIVYPKGFASGQLLLPYSEGR